MIPTHTQMNCSCHWPVLTWNLGGELGDDRGAVAFGCAGAQGEGVRGARVEACEHVGGLVAQLHYLPTLVGEVQLRVKGTHSLVGDLGGSEMNILMVASGWICIRTTKPFHVEVIQVAKRAEADSELKTLWSLGSAAIVFNVYSTSHWDARERNPCS